MASPEQSKGQFSPDYAEELQRVQEFEKLLQHETERPLSGDIYVQSYARAMLRAVEQPSYRHAVAEMARVRKLSGNRHEAGDIFNILLRGLMKQIIAHEEALGYETLQTRYPDFPIGFDEEKWSDVIHTVMDEAYPGHDDFIFDIWTREVQSNVSERYKTVPLILNAMPHRFSGPITITDFACSLNRGNKKLVSQTPFLPFAAEDGIDSSVLLDRASRPLDIRQAVGIDVMDMNEPQNRLWAEVCSMRPAERLIEGMVNEYRRLDTMNFGERVKFMKKDIVAQYPADPDAWISHPSKNFSSDVVTKFTFEYQLSEAEAEISLERAAHEVAPDGLVIVQEFVELDPNSRRGYRLLSPEMFTRPWTYQTLVLDMAQPEHGLQPIFTWRSGRCDALKLTLPLYDMPESELSDVQRSVLSYLI